MLCVLHTGSICIQVWLAHRAGQAKRRAVLHLQQREVQRRAGVDGRVVLASLDAALQVPFCQHPQGAPSRRALQRSDWTGEPGTTESEGASKRAGLIQARHAELWFPRQYGHASALMTGKITGHTSVCHRLGSVLAPQPMVAASVTQLPDATRHAGVTCKTTARTLGCGYRMAVSTTRPCSTRSTRRSFSSACPTSSVSALTRPRNRSCELGHGQRFWSICTASAKPARRLRYVIGAR